MFAAGVAELRRLGFEPVFDATVFARRGYTAGDPDLRAQALRRAWSDPSIRAIMAVRGGYGSVQLLSLLDAAEVARSPKIFVGYSDNTSLIVWLVQRAGLVAFHGPMLEGRIAAGETGYDRDTFTRVLMTPAAAGLITHSTVEVIRRGEAEGVLTGGTLTQLAASLGTPFAFDPPAGHVLFIDEVGERPYRIDRLLTQLRLAGILSRASGIVFGELPRCDEPGDGGPSIRRTVEDLIGDFRGPVLFGLPSGHTSGASLTLPFGVKARIVTVGQPGLEIEEAAVV